MLPRLHTSSLAADKASAFAGGRPLRIMLDEALPATDSVGLLRAFVGADGVEYCSTHKLPAVAHVELGPLEADRDAIPVRVGTSHRVIAAAAQYTRFADRIAAQHGWRSAPVEAALVRVQAARVLDVDVFVTADPFVLEHAPRGLVRDANPMDPEAALAVLGLSLRSRGSVTIPSASGWTDTLSRDMYFWVLARALLDSAWRWFSACVGPAFPEVDDLPLLAQAALERFARALRVRDAILISGQPNGRRSASEDGIFFLDVALLMLSGAFDAVARVAHRVYNLPGSEHAVGWRRTRWRASLDVAEPRFSALLATGTEAADTVEILGRLRNTVHGSGLPGIGYSSGSLVPVERLARVPAADTPALMDAMHRHGGASSWGVRSLGPDGIALQPDRFIDTLLPACARALNVLMDATDVTRLPGVAADLNVEPDRDDNLFGDEMLRKSRLLAGL